MQARMCWEFACGEASVHCYVNAPKAVRQPVTNVDMVRSKIEPMIFVLVKPVLNRLIFLAIILCSL